MLVQYRPLPETLITEGAIIGLLPRVNTHVLLKVRGLPEQLPTIRAHVGPVRAVGALVLLQPLRSLNPCWHFIFC